MAQQTIEDMIKDESKDRFSKEVIREIYNLSYASLYYNETPYERKQTIKKIKEKIEKL